MSSMVMVSLVLPHKKRYFVYTLGDPVFYVGKGSGARVWSHEQEARNTGCICRRCKAIRKVWNSGNDVLVNILYETDVEEDAYIYEWGMINVYASPHLTNGAGNVYERVRKQQEETRRCAINNTVSPKQFIEKWLAYANAPLEEVVNGTWVR